MKRIIARIAMVAIALLTYACNKDGGNSNLPTAPETGLAAGWSVTVTPPAANDGDCRIRFTGQASGGKPGYAFLWDFGALPVRAKQRIGSDSDQTVEFVTTSTTIGTGTYGTRLVVTDKNYDTKTINGFVSYNCTGGASPTTFSF
jgi:hypothetical protein